MRTINRILVANRGEIALRVIRTAKDMGISTVAVYADQDMTAPHTREADLALALDGDDAASTYLSADKLLQIAVESGADAIHPGYGFLSENPEFARAIENTGIAWIGPAPGVIEALGDKISARRVAQACGVAPVPGLSEPVTARAEVEGFIAEHGYPVVLKRADGGGGRGITVVRSSADLDLFFARHTDAADLGAHFV
ncbi:MAG: carboxylate--amine ligase, partial [Schaalia georgiae]|nr:carboxylate--amine ligase [Schaalia georgiae]